MKLSSSPRLAIPGQNHTHSGYSYHKKSEIIISENNGSEWPYLSYISAHFVALLVLRTPRKKKKKQRGRHEHPTIKFVFSFSTSTNFSPFFNPRKKIHWRTTEDSLKSIRITKRYIFRGGLFVAVLIFPLLGFLFSHTIVTKVISRDVTYSK